MPSDIHVLVRFQDQCVFAGEELKCSITFKNVLEPPELQRPLALPRQNSRSASIGQIAGVASRQPSGPSDNGIFGSRTSRNPSHGSPQIGELAFQKPSATGDQSPQSAPEGGAQSRRLSHNHQKSISIISRPPSGGSPSQTHFPPGSGQRPPPAHRRSSTIQVSSGSFQASQRTQNQYNSLGLNLQSQGGRRSPLSSTATSTPVLDSRKSTPDFQFPSSEHQNDSSSHPREPSPRGPAPKPPTTRVRREVSTSSHVASERSSAEFYSLSNHSQETLMSEQPSVLSDRPQLPNSLMRRHYRMESVQQRRPQAANLLMGYAHLNATFTVDGSLVDQSQFEEVKKKGFLGGQAGGGVVGVNKSRPTSGFLGGFNFNSIGESLNSLVGGDNMSSVKEMNAVTSSRAVPLLSTPQSLLFVDLRLEPGEEKSYDFSCTVPRGLPSSYRGKAIKISYNILIGVQGIPGNKDVHKVRQVSLPVRVFSGVDSDGEIFGHDLMQPHVILKDLARTKSIDPTTDELEKPVISSSRKNGTSDEFLQFVDTLLDRNRRRQSSSGTMDALLGGNPEASDANPTIHAINRAIQLSNQLPNPTTTNEASPNRFSISRAGQNVATIQLDRPLHRLGEPVTAVITFPRPAHNSKTKTKTITCASLHATLETTEKVSPSLAIRSEASITRVTRRIYVAHSENLLFSQRAVFVATIPANATPTFVTSGVCLDWSLRFEFGTVVAPGREDGDREDEDGDGGEGDRREQEDGEQEDDAGGREEKSHQPDLFEELVKDERGIVSVAVERLECETFDVVIPITVYGDVTRDSDGQADVDGIPI